MREKRPKEPGTAGLWSRLLWLDRKIREGRHPNVAAVEEEFGVSRRAAFKTVEYLRDSLGAPLRYAREHRGYEYADPAYGLPQVFLGEGELLALLLAEEVTRQYLGTPLEGPIRSAVGKVSRYLPESVAVELGTAADLIRVSGTTGPDVSLTLMADLQRAVRERRVVRILYYTASRGETRERTIEPHFLENVQGDWMLAAWDRWRDEDRVFMLSRIREHAVLEETFRQRAELDPRTYDRHTFRTERGTAGPQEVSLRFDAYQARWIRERTWHPSQRLEELPDGGVRLRLEVSGEGDLVRWVLGYGSHVEVEAPAGLRERVAEELRRAARVYQNLMSVELGRQMQEGGKRWRALWAKSEPYHPLWKHMLDAAAVSLAMRNPLEQDGWAPETLAWVVSLHDVGKADPAFQHQEARPVAELEERLRERSAENGRDEGLRRLRAQLGAARASIAVRQAGLEPTADAWCRHEKLSALFLRERLREAGADEYYAAAVARAVVAHHGHWEEPTRPSPPEYVHVQEQIAAVLRECLNAPALPRERPPDLSAFGMRLAGHVVLCDWIASNEAFFHRETLTATEDPAEYFLRSRAVAAEMVDRLALRPDHEGGRPEEIVERPRPLQRALLHAALAPGLVVIEAPMGEGKTEAAWILAEQWCEEGYHGAYMALPTQATGDAIFHRYDQDYLRKLKRGEKVHLIHGMAWLRDEKEPETPFVTHGERSDDGFAAQWFRPTRRAMLAAHGAGTVDQFLLAGLNARFGFLRLYGLDRRVLVVDEVHAYDAYMTAILARGLAWCAALRIPVVLLSATLSAAQRAQLLQAYGAREPDPGPDADYPLVTHVSFDGAVKTLAPQAAAARRLTLTPCPGLLGDAGGTARLAEKLARDEKCVCVIANTVRQAQRIYQELNLDEGEKGLFHARFTAARRKEVAEAVIDRFGKDRSRRPERYVLVATQVAEQSLDVDFDEMLSELAPIDLLLQRSGRLHRHLARSTPPELRVLLPEAGVLQFGGTQKVYDRYVLLRTLALTADPREVELPRDFRPLIEAVYGEEAIPESVVPDAVVDEARREWVKGTEEMEAAAGPYLLNAPKARLFRPVGNAPVGDDSDDGNGWRATTRLGANDRTCLFVRERNLERTRAGAFPMHVVRELYRRTMRMPSYLRLDRPDDGYQAAVEAQGALRGLTLVPYGEELEWRGGGLRVRYGDELGLVVEKA